MISITNNKFGDISSYLSSTSERNNTHKLKILEINAQSCANFKTFDEIKDFIDKHANEIDIVIICETWFKTNENLIFEIEGYLSIHSCRLIKKGGGLSMYINNQYKIVNTQVYQGEINMVYAEILNIKNIRKLSVCGIYRPPVYANIKTFMEQTEKMLTKMSTNDAVYAGDINLDVDGNCMHSKEYTDLLKSYGFKICNTNVTRSASNRLIDHIFTNLANRFDHHSDTIEHEFSDHNIIMTNINTNFKNKQKFVEIKKTNYTKFSELENENLNKDSLERMDINNAYNYISETLKDALTVSTVTIKKKCSKVVNCEWLKKCPNLSILINKKNNFWKKHKTELRSEGCRDVIRKKNKELN